MPRALILASPGLGDAPAGVLSARAEDRWSSTARATEVHASRCARRAAVVPGDGSLQCSML
eukprot:scaffold26975_cov135-Isochrysis_galbana.AAC.1